MRSPIESPDARRREQIAALYAVLATARTDLPRTGLLALIPSLAMLVGEALGAWLMLAEGDQLTTLVTQGAAVDALAAAAYPRAGESVVCQAARARAPLVLPADALAPDPVLAPLAHTPGSVALVPIGAADALVGLLGVVIRPGATADLALLTALAEHAAGLAARDLAQSQPTPEPPRQRQMLAAITHDTSARRTSEQALRRSEARFEHFAAAVSDIFWISDPQQRRVLYVSPAYEQIIGRSAAALYANFMEWIEAIHPDDRPRVEAAFFRHANADGYDEEFRVICPDGSIRWIRDRSFPMLDEDGGRTIAAGIAEDITARKQAEDARRERDMLRWLAEAQDEERLRIARDLHDQLGQQITGLQLGLKQLEGQVAGTAAAATLSPLQALAHSLAKEAHRIAMDLRPTALDDMGLVPALECLVADWSLQTGISAAFVRLDLRDRRLPRPVELALFRVAQEALTNVHKHAGATNVGVVLKQRDSQVIMVIEDNGRGLVAEDARSADTRLQLGMLRIRERVSQVGGSVEIESSPTSGTAIFIRIPV